MEDWELEERTKEKRSQRWICSKAKATRPAASVYRCGAIDNVNVVRDVI